MFMNKPVCLALSILEISKIVMYEFWYEYMEPKQEKKQKYVVWIECCFIVNIKTEGIYVEIIKDIERRLDTSNHGTRRQLPKGKNKKVIWLVKNELVGKTMTESGALRPKAYSYLAEINNKNKQVQGTKKYVIKQKL